MIYKIIKSDEEDKNIKNIYSKIGCSRKIVDTHHPQLKEKLRSFYYGQS
jgi:hypothetical protein